MVSIGSNPMSVYYGYNHFVSERLKSRTYSALMTLISGSLVGDTNYSDVYEHVEEENLHLGRDTSTGIIHHTLTGPFKS